MHAATFPHESRKSLRRLGPRAKSHLIRTARNRMRERLRRIKRTERMLTPSANVPEHNTPKIGPHQVTLYRSGTTRQTWARERKEMPRIFCLTENHDEVGTFLAELRHSIITTAERFRRNRARGGSAKRSSASRRAIDTYFDFGSMEQITPATALVLASEFDRAQTISGVPDWLQAINVEQWKPRVYTTLDDVGFLSLLGVEEQRRTLASRGGCYTVPFLSGTKVVGAKIEKLIRAMAELASNEGLEEGDQLLRRSRVYDGLGEAIQNVEDHAYPETVQFAYPVLRRWWVTGAVEPGKKRFNIVTYDQGITIPGHLPLSNYFDDFRAAFLRFVGSEFDATRTDKDGEAIAQAAELGRSSTGKEWHGKGLPRMREIVNYCEHGTLRILSRCGEYVFSHGGKSTYRSFKVPLNGTLVEWDLYL